MGRWIRSVGRILAAVAPYSRGWRVLAAVAVVLGLAVYLVLLVHFVDACAGGADSSGYLIEARQLSAGRISFPPRVVPGLDTTGLSAYYCIPLGAKPSPVHKGELVPTYPAGLPLLIAAAHLFLGWGRAFDLVILVHAILGLVLLVALGRALGFGPFWCLAGVVLLATGPLYLQFSLQGMSDLPALAWSSATALAAWRARKSAGWSAVAGMAFSLSVLIRPNDALMLAPLLVAWWPFGPARPSVGFVRRVLLFVAGGLPGGIFWLLFNRWAYGGALTTGYGDVTGSFLAQLVPTTLKFYAHWLPVVFTPLVLLCLGLPWAAGRSRAAAFLAVWAGAYLALFTFDRYVHESWMLLRYILPAAPALVLGSLAVARRALESPPFRWRHWPRAVAVLALTASLAGQLEWDGKLKVLYAGRGEGTYAQAMAWLNSHIPEDSILVTMQTSGAAFFYTAFPLIRWDQLDAGSFRRLAEAAASQRRALYAPLFDFERQRAMGANLPGEWRPAGQVRQITIWRYEDPEPSRPHARP